MLPLLAAAYSELGGHPHRRGTGPGAVTAMADGDAVLPGMAPEGEDDDNL